MQNGLFRLRKVHFFRFYGAVHYDCAARDQRRCTRMRQQNAEKVNERGTIRRGDAALSGQCRYRGRYSGGNGLRADRKSASEPGAPGGGLSLQILNRPRVNA